MTEDWRTRARREMEEARESLAAFTAAFVPPATREEILQQIRESGAMITHFSPNLPEEELVTILAQIRWMQSQEQS